MQLQNSEDKRTALVAGCEDETKHKKGKERYLGIVIPQLTDKGVKGWCISWVEGKVISVFTSARKKRRGIDMILTKRYKESAAVTPCAR